MRKEALEALQRRIDENRKDIDGFVADIERTDFSDPAMVKKAVHALALSLHVLNDQDEALAALLAIEQQAR